MSSGNERLLIVGLHTRPAVASAKRSGYAVASADYFGDVDLKKLADESRSIVEQRPYRSNGRQAENYSEERLIEIAHELEGEKIILTSTLAMHSSKIAGISGRRAKKLKDKAYQLKKLGKLGIALPETRVVRSREEAVQAAEEIGFPVVVKPALGAGGEGVVLVHSQEEIPEIRECFLVQEYIRGKAISVSTLSYRSQSVAISTSVQLLGSRLVRAGGFRYCGSIAPYSREERLLSLAEEVASLFNLRGWNGIDFVERHGEYYFIELNPRFQGTLDVVERAYHLDIVAAHLAACEGELPEQRPRPRNCAARLTLFAGERCIVRGNLLKLCSDVPVRNAIIEAGEPITTVLGSAQSRRGALQKVKEKAARVYSRYLYPIPEAF
ncbi:ATP-grasp domain-containing protein [Candidatus Pyrohabitans sp.]